MSNFEGKLNPFTGKLQIITKDSILENLQNNNVINAFDIANIGEKVMYQMDDQIIDDYQDLSGVDVGNSSGYTFDGDNDFLLTSGGQAGIDTDTLLMLHCNGEDESTTFTDSRLVSPHTVTANGTSQIDTDEKKWGTASGLFDGNSDYLSIPDSADWDFVGSLTDSRTIDLWAKFTEPNKSGQYQALVCQVQIVGNSFWNLYLNQQDIVFAHFVGSVAKSNATASDVITDTNWHHIAVCKVADKIGVYIDGVQVAYSVMSSADTYSAGLSIGYLTGYNLATCTFGGHMDEIKIQKSNSFNASPNVGLTDTIILPIAEYSTTAEYDDMVIQSEAFTADTAPSELSIIMREEDVESVVLNTDLKIFGSRDSGTTWTQGTLTGLGDQVGVQRNLKAGIDVSGQPSGTSIKYKIESFAKGLIVHALSESWKT